MPAKQYHRFTQFSKEGMDFIKMWNSADRDGIQDNIADRFGISITLVYRIRKMLNLPNLHDAKNHPGKKALYKRIKRLYFCEERSTLQIAKIIRMSDDRINQILKEQDVELRPQHCTNPKYFKTRSGISPSELLKKIRTMYLDKKMSAKQIAKQLGIDQGTVRTKLKCMRIELRNNKKEYRLKNGGYPCLWCGQIMEKVYINTGIRKQLYCCSSHNNKAKDLRRMIKGKRVSLIRLESFESELKTAWKEKYHEARSRILDAEPINLKNASNIKRGVEIGEPSNTV